MSAFSNAVAMKAQGKTVGDLRKAGISPADIRAAGYTLQQMHEHLGIHRLNEAGFTLSDYMAAHIELREIGVHFALADILRTNRTAYSLADLASKYPGEELRRFGGFTAAEFVSQANTTAAELHVFGFSEEEIASSGVNNPRTPALPGRWQPPHAANMQIGDTWSYRHEDVPPRMEVTFTRLPESEARQLHLRLIRPNLSVVPSNTYSYEGSGKNCPRCGRHFILVEQDSDVDDMRAREKGTWICDDVKCGMQKKEHYEGYGTIF